MTTSVTKSVWSNLTLVFLNKLFRSVYPRACLILFSRSCWPHFCRVAGYWLLNLFLFTWSFSFFFFSLSLIFFLFNSFVCLLFSATFWGNTIMPSWIQRSALGGLVNTLAFFGQGSVRMEMSQGGRVFLLFFWKRVRSAVATDSETAGRIYVCLKIEGESPFKWPQEEESWNSGNSYFRFMIFC